MPDPATPMQAVAAALDAATTALGQHHERSRQRQPVTGSATRPAPACQRTRTPPSIA
ncbi:hypothetical protein OHA72_33590 [Dactylosporangium sp. NBC_01737]|uniref:hypothetical protein n=1 Tax=Dactylosporangium sp. NBC_01737 TaxID=2975959 RepID=UPI002E116629|nr:hypothetical protein OHA72_33590 [Dactylosporangium sp. NBC_01737]